MKKLIKLYKEETGENYQRDKLIQWVKEKTMFNLSPCPFCGSEVIRYIEDDGYIVECESCECSTPMMETLEEAAIIWNTRAEQSTKESIFNATKKNIESIKVQLNEALKELKSKKPDKNLLFDYINELAYRIESIIETSKPEPPKTKEDFYEFLKEEGCYDHFMENWVSMYRVGVERSFSIDDIIRVKDFTDILGFCFNWNLSPQKHNYWLDISSKWRSKFND